MRLTKSLLKTIVKEELVNSQGLTTIFRKGDTIKDINPDCPHVGSEGIVTKVTADDVTYTVTNNGEAYQDGMELTKTKDQVIKLNSDEIDEDFAMGKRKERVSKTKKTAEVFGHTMVGEVEEPSWDLTKNKDRGDNLGESVIPLTEIRKVFWISKINPRGKLKDILAKAIQKLSGAKILDMAKGQGGIFIKVDIESKYMDVLGDFIKKYDRTKSIVIIDQHKTVVYNANKGINKLGEGKLNERNERFFNASVEGIYQDIDRLLKAFKTTEYSKNKNAKKFIHTAKQLKLKLHMSLSGITHNVKEGKLNETSPIAKSYKAIMELEKSIQKLEQTFKREKSGMVRDRAYNMAKSIQNLKMCWNRLYTDTQER